MLSPAETASPKNQPSSSVVRLPTTPSLPSRYRSKKPSAHEKSARAVTAIPRPPSEANTLRALAHSSGETGASANGGLAGSPIPRDRLTRRRNDGYLRRRAKRAAAHDSGPTFPTPTHGFILAVAGLHVLL